MEKVGKNILSYFNQNFIMGVLFYSWLTSNSEDVLNWMLKKYSFPKIKHLSLVH